MSPDNGHVLSTPSLDEIRKNCEAVATADPSDTQKVASVLLEMSLNYYEHVRREARQSFYSALGAAVVGTCFFIVGAGFFLGLNGEKAKISLIAGALVQVISGINFYLYGKSARQFAMFHVCLERMNRFLVANSICTNLESAVKRDEARAELVHIMAEAQMLSIDGINGATSRARNRTPSFKTSPPKTI